MLRVTKVTSLVTDRLEKKKKKKHNENTTRRHRKSSFYCRAKKSTVHKGNRGPYFYDKQKQFHNF